MLLSLVENTGLTPWSYGMVLLLTAVVVGGESKLSQTVNIGDLAQRVVRTLRNLLMSWMFLFKGPQVIQQGYKKSKGGPFEVFAPDNRYVFVSSPKHVKEIDTASPEVLSLFTATKQMLQPRYTMHGFNWPNVRGTDGVGFIKALRTMLTNHLPTIVPKVDGLVATELAEIVRQAPGATGAKKLHIFDELSKLVVLANAYAFFGEELAFDAEFMQYASTTTEQTFMYAELIRLLPKWSHPWVGQLVLRLSTSQAGMYKKLIKVVEARLEDRANQRIGHKVDAPQDCISWIADTAPKAWPAYRIVYELIAIWFGSVHGISITATFALHDMCQHPEYLAPLRQELAAEYEAFKATGSGLPLLDSFIKESARLSPVESMSGRRQALRPFAFSDGTAVNKGEWVCTPAAAIMQDEAAYPEARTFNGFRFASSEALRQAMGERVAQPEGPSKLTDVNERWHIWGIGRITCPGRFYASATMKIILAQIIQNYDVELADKKAPRSFTWRSSMVPRHSSVVVFSPRSNPSL